jgi:hypothetical protein
MYLASSEQTSLLAAASSLLRGFGISLLHCIATALETY